MFFNTESFNLLEGCSSSFIQVNFKFIGFITIRIKVKGSKITYKKTMINIEVTKLLRFRPSSE